MWDTVFARVRLWWSRAMAPVTWWSPRGGTGHLYLCQRLMSTVPAPVVTRWTVWHMWPVVCPVPGQTLASTVWSTGTIVWSWSVSLVNKVTMITAAQLISVGYNHNNAPLSDNIVSVWWHIYWTHTTVACIWCIISGLGDVNDGCHNTVWWSSL